MGKAFSGIANWSRRVGRRAGSGGSRGRFRPVLLELEGRRLPSTFTVTSTDDHGGSGTLRSAILQADAAGGSNTIAFDPTVFGTPQSITLSGGELLLTSGAITINGPGAGLLTVNGNQFDRIFQIYAGVTASISGLTITNGGSTIGGGLYVQGNATLANCTIRGNSATDGGGLYNSGRLTLTGCTISGNSAKYGGALWTRGTATLTGCTISGNSSYMGGGVLNYKGGHANLTGCTISGNSASLGGGLSNYGQANLTACTVSGNTATDTTPKAAYNPGGGIYNYSNHYGGKTTLLDTIVAGNSGAGGAASDIGGLNRISVIGTYNLVGTGGSGGVRNGIGGNIVLTSLAGLGLAPLADYGGPTLTMALLSGSPAIGKGTTVSGVTTDQRGFALDSPNPDIGAFQAASVPLVVAVTTDGSGAPSGELDLRGAVNLANLQSGAVAIAFDSTVFSAARTIALTTGPLMLTGTGGPISMTGPTAGLTLSGGGTARVVQVGTGVTASLSGLTISGGSATLGGGLYNAGTLTLTSCTISGSTAGIGGGLDNRGTAILADSTITGDTATYGGGLANDGTLTLTECTIAGNSASSRGGGLFNASQASLTACTVSGNSAGSTGGGLYEGGTGSDLATLGDTIVAGNAGSGGSASDIGGRDAANVGGTYDLIGTGGSGGILNGSGGNIVLTSLANLGLAPLGNYGGPTLTIALLPGCPAIDAGSNSLIPSGVNTDQRGQGRIVGSAVDIGAFESQGFTLTPVAGSTPQNTSSGTSFSNPLAVSITANNPAEPVAGGILTFTVNPTGSAAAILSAGSAMIGIAGSAQVTATANATAGTYSVTASAAGTAPIGFTLTNQGQATFSGLADQSIVYGTASATFSGTIFAGSQAPAGESVAVSLDGVIQQATIASDGSFSTTFSNTAGLGVAGSPYTVTYSYSGDSTRSPASQTSKLTVTKAAPTVAVSDAGGTYNGSPFPATATVAGGDGHAGPTLEGAGLTLSYYAGSTTTGTPLSGPSGDAGTYTVLAAFPGSADYIAQTAQVTFTITRATPTITWAAPGSIVYGTALGAAQLDATANVPGTFAYNPAAGTILGAGARVLSTTFTPTDTADYTTATATINIVVSQATPSITWATPASIVYGTALGTAQLDATADVAGTFAYTPASGRLLGGGSHTLSVTFTPSDSTDYTTATATTTLLVSQATPTITWDTPAPIVYGTALGPAQLDATANVPGTFAYSPAAGVILAAGAHALSVTFTPTDSADYASVTGTTNLDVSQANPTITWNAPTPIVYGTALGAAQLDATADVPGAFAYTPAAGTLLGAGVHTLSVTFTPTDSTDYTTATATTPLSVSQATPTITWGTPTPIVYGTALGAAQLDATASVLGSFAYSPVAGTLLGAGSHTLSVTFTPTDSTDYTSATATTSITVTKATPTVAVAGGGTYDGAPIPATATVAGVVAGVDSAPGPSLEGIAPALTYYAGGVATGTPLSGPPMAVGTYTAAASFPGSADYAAATAQATFAITPATFSITWDAPASIVYGTPLGAAQLDATASVPGSFTYTPTAGTVLGAGVHTLSATFTPDDATNYTSATVTTTLNVSQAIAAITWNSPSPIVYGTALRAMQLDATASAPGLFAYTPAAGTVLGAGLHTLSVTFTPDDATDYSPATATTTITVSQATPAVTWPTPPSIIYGTALGAAQLDATANVQGSFAYGPGPRTVLGAGVHTLSVTFTPDDTTNYSTATATTSITVAKASPTLGVAGGGAYDGSPIPATATVAGVVAGVDSAPGPTLEGVSAALTYYAGATPNGAPLSGAPATAGMYTVVASFPGSADYAAATAQATFAITPATPSITWGSPAPIVYGTPLGAAQLDATANVPGDFTYSPAAGAVLGVGVQALSVTFIPTDSTDYTSATATTSITITSATPSVTWSVPAPIVYATPLTSTQLDATANVPGRFTYTPDAGVALGAGLQTLSVMFAPDDATDYVSVTATTTITVSKARPTLTWAAPAPIVYGTALGAAQLDATASVQGRFVYSPAAGSILGAGVHTLSVSFSPDDSTNYTSATATTTIDVSQANPALTWGTPGPIVYGTALGPAQLDATANVPGAFAYSPAQGTVLGAGPHWLSVAFTPTDSADESTATATTSITVTKATPTVGVSDGGGVYSGSPFPATATVAGISGVTSPSLEGISPVLTYYAGSTATGPPLGGPPTAVGTYTVIASFPGSADYASASSPTVTFSILAPAVTITLGSSAGSTVFGESLTLTANVSLSGPGAGTPTGTVTFYDGAAALASVPLDPTGRAVLTISSLGLGGHSIAAVYAGDALSRGGRSGTVSESVAPADTQVILVPHAIMRRKKIASLSLTAEVEPLAPGGGVPTGLVTFRVKRKTIGTAALSGGQATLRVKPGSVLNKSLTISYGGAAEFRSASLAASKLTSRSLTTLPRPFTNRRRARPAIGHASVSHPFSHSTAKTRHDPSGVIAHS